MTAKKNAPVATPVACWGKENGMKRSGTLLAAIALMVVASACSNPLKFVVDNYFRAINQGDSQTLSSFATVGFGKKVQSWKVVQIFAPTEAPAPLPDLIQKAKEAEAAVTANKRDVRNYNFDHTLEVDQVKEARKNGRPVPARLQAVAQTWDKFIEKDRELKRAFSEAKAAAEKEKQTVLLSVSGVENVESLSGTLVTQQAELQLTVDGQQAPYTMTLRQYKLVGPGGLRAMSRWVVTGLEPKR
jgi:hypothetical protein